MSIAKSDKIMPVAGMENILKEAGANRVSEDAKEELKKTIEEYATRIAEKAIKFAHHAGRKTIRPEDIKIAMKE